ncbi:hypothetical protein N7486_005024 [Penicillium sp. IBT 16267x]|nr:hypothetical protein N7486_005024 [Penicillium sp. IBT 16267x]
MYLLYDVIQLRNSCLGNSLLIKRSQWTSVIRDLNSLSSDRLRKAAEELAMRAEIRGLLVREGMPVFWLIINLSDLQNPLCLTDGSTSVSSAIRCATVTSDPVAVARFFHCICRAVLDGLLGSKPAEMGILGDVSNYFRVIESNGRAMLHLHTLVWMRGNLDSSPGASVLSTPPLPTTPESDSEFIQKLFLNSNAIARTRQLHSKRHTATCFKYRQPGSAHDSYRFGMLRDLLEASKVNPWNPSIASYIRSNHNISWIPTVSKSLSLLYYIINYATKDDVSPA